jgi:hypothetical protein
MYDTGSTSKSRRGAMMTITEVRPATVGRRPQDSGDAAVPEQPKAASPALVSVEFFGLLECVGGTSPLTNGLLLENARGAVARGWRIPVYASMPGVVGAQGVADIFGVMFGLSKELVAEIAREVFGDQTPSTGRYNFTLISRPCDGDPLRLICQIMATRA